MKKLLSLILLPLFIQCTGEIASGWWVEWKIQPSSHMDFSMATFSFSIDIDQDVEFFNGKIDSMGNLTQYINISGYNHSQVFEINPNVHFLFHVNSISVKDTMFEWSEMQFENSHSKKEILINN